MASNADQIAQLTARLEALQRQYTTQAARPQHGMASGFHGGTGARSNAYATFQNQQAALNNQIMALRGQDQEQERQSKYDAERARMEAAREEGFGLARNRIGELRGDPMDAAIREALMARIGGQDQPFDETTTNALFTDRAQQGAAAAQAQIARLRGNPNDPAYQAAVREIMDRSMRGSQDARLQVDMQANLANYDARGQAIGQAAPINLARNNQITDAERYLTGMLRDEAATPEIPGGGSGGGGGGMMTWDRPVVATQSRPAVPSYQSYVQGTVTRPAPAPAPRPTVGPTTTTYTPQQLAQQGYARPVQRPIPGMPAGTGSTNGVGYVPRPSNTTPPIIGTQQFPKGGGFVQKAGQPQTRINNPGTWY